MTVRVALAVLPLVLVGGASCGGKSVDPRCTSLCLVNEPDVSGAYDVCSASSAEACKRECDARIADVATVCASCLLEDACFAPSCGGVGHTLTECDSSGHCTITGREGQCTYQQGDQAAQDDCIRQVYPRRTVDCTPDFRPVAECSAVCGAGG